MKTYKLKRVTSRHYSTGVYWEPVDETALGICHERLAKLITIPPQANTLWITLTKRKPGPNALRISVSDDRDCGHLRVDGWEGYIYLWLREKIEEVGLPCWAVVEYG